MLVFAVCCACCLIAYQNEARVRREEAIREEREMQVLPVVCHELYRAGNRRPVPKSELNVAPLAKRKAALHASTFSMGYHR